MIFALVAAPRCLSQNIKINEILASNTSINTDEDGSHQDWVELYNLGPAAVNLNGYGLSDDTTLPFKWTFPAVSVPSGGYLLIWCSDKDRAVAGSPLHTNFKISASGEIITLTAPGGTTVDQVPAVEMLADVSYGRSPNGSANFVFFSNVTPAAANPASGFSEALPPPTFSHAAGFYTSGFSLTISTTVPGATILYTVDGSEPDASHIGGTTYTYKNKYPELPGQTTGPLLTQSYGTLQYSAPLSIVDRSSQPNKISMISSTMDFTPIYLPASPIFKGTVVRAKVIKPGALPSKTESRSYFITPEGSSRFSLPVVSISISEDKLYDYNNGIYVAGVDFDNWRAANPTLVHDGIEDIGNFYRSGIDNERVANLSYFVSGTEVLNQDIGIRLHGGSSREWPNKSLNFYARADYGTPKMDYPFFAGLPANFEHVTLRNSGADFYETLFRDALNQQLMKHLHVETKGYQPTITFMNGEYWGILNLRDKVDAEYFLRMYDIPTDQVDIIDSENDVQEGDFDHYGAMIDYVNTHSLATQANYDYIVTQLDPENFADYFISNIFFENVDWPGNNIMRWRQKTASYLPDAPYGHDGRWRWIAHDMDATFATYSLDYSLNSLAAATATNGPEWPNPAWSTLLLRKMLQNPGFKNYFITRFADLMNSSFLSSRIVETIDQMSAVLDPEMEEQTERWKAPEDYGSWIYDLGIEKDFANARPAFQRNHIRSKFSIASNINATLDVSNAAHGYIKINTIEIKNGTDGIAANPYPWTGIYFSNIPITLKAIANPGYVFDHWTGASTSTSDTITLTSASSISVTAVFVPDGSPTANEPVYFWMMDGTMPNNLPLTTLNSTYQQGSTGAMIEYQSSLPGYPFDSTNPLWRKASMERRNSPTMINYIPEANNDLPFASSDMKGLQIKEPLQTGSDVNTMVFDLPTTGYKDLKFSFAAMNELTNATGISIAYSTAAGAPVWSTAGLASSTLPLGAAFQLYETDFTSIAAANNNANFKIRLSFTGTNLTADAGNRVTFNNIALRGTLIPLDTLHNETPRFSMYPNPATESVFITGLAGSARYRIFTADGRLVKSGEIEPTTPISVSELTIGMYLVQIESDGKTEVKKLLRK